MIHQTVKWVVLYSGYCGSICKTEEFFVILRSSDITFAGNVLWIYLQDRGIFFILRSSDKTFAGNVLWIYLQDRGIFSY